MTFSLAGDDAPVSVYGLAKESVLLPCNCSNMEKPEFYWQKERDNKEDPEPILGYNNVLNISENYTGRVNIFQDENMNNCSLHLQNITVDDQGTYRCSYIAGSYHYSFVHLTIFERHYQHPPTTTSGGKTLFKCDFFLRNRNVKILWRSDGVFINSSLEINISSTETKDSFTGIHVFSSTLTTTQSNWTSEPKCVHNDVPVASGVVSPPPRKDPRSRLGMVFVFLIVLLLGLFLLSLHHWKLSRQPKSYQKTDCSCLSGGG